MSVGVYANAGELADAQEPFAIATVVRVQGWSSARSGSKAIIDAQGREVTGWVGGCAENAVRSEALNCLQAEGKSLEVVGSRKAADVGPQFALPSAQDDGLRCGPSLWEWSFSVWESTACSTIPAP